MRVLNIDKWWKGRYKWGPARVVILVDDDDYEKVSRYTWYINFIGRERLEGEPLCYAVSSRVGAMHRFLLGDPKGMHVHHKDGNGLNNSKENLEVISPARHIKLHIRR